MSRSFEVPCREGLFHSTEDAEPKELRKLANSIALCVSG